MGRAGHRVGWSRPPLLRTPYRPGRGAVRRPAGIRTGWAELVALWSSIPISNAAVQNIFLLQHLDENDSDCTTDLTPKMTGTSPSARLASLPPRLRGSQWQALRVWGPVQQCKRRWFRAEFWVFEAPTKKWWTSLSIFFGYAVNPHLLPDFNMDLQHRGVSYMFMGGKKMPVNFRNVYAIWQPAIFQAHADPSEKRMPCAPANTS